MAKVNCSVVNVPDSKVTHFDGVTGVAKTLEASRIIAAKMVRSMVGYGEDGSKWKTRGEKRGLSSEVDNLAYKDFRGNFRERLGGLSLGELNLLCRHT